MTSPKPFDPQLHDPAISEAYRDASAASAGPSAAIDDAIRAHARRAVNAGPRPVRPSWTRRAAIPFALAATVVLAVGVGLRMNEYDDMTVRHTRERLPMADQTPVTAAKPAEAPAAVPAEAPRAESRQAEAPRVEAPRVEAPRVEAPRVETPRVETQVSERKSAAPAGPSVSIAQGKVTQDAEQAPRARANIEEASRDAATTAAPATAPPPAPVAPRELARESVRNEAIARGDSDAASSGLRKRGADSVQAGAAAPAPAPAASAPMRAQAAPSAPRVIGGAASTAAAPDTPDALVLRIRDMLRDNRADEAKRLVGELRERFPQFVLPDDLKAFAP